MSSYSFPALNYRSTTSSHWRSSYCTPRNPRMQQLLPPTNLSVCAPYHPSTRCCTELYCMKNHGEWCYSNKLSIRPICRSHSLSLTPNFISVSNQPLVPSFCLHRIRLLHSFCLRSACFWSAQPHTQRLPGRRIRAKAAVTNTSNTTGTSAAAAAASSRPSPPLALPL